jgi:hypothetical protein
MILFSKVASPNFEIGIGTGEIDYKKIHSRARPNGDDEHVAIRSVADATGASLMQEHRWRDLPSRQRGVIDEPKNEFVFNGNAGFPCISTLWSNS